MKVMLNSNSFSQLIAPVLVRAQMDASASSFIDTAARQLLNNFGIYTDSLQTPQKEEQLSLCRWIDRQACAFFLHYPKGHGVEINSGLSTRFHRLSQVLDWPQFSWCSVNDFEVINYLQSAFPRLDNYTATGAYKPLHEWSKYLNWENTEPKLIIVDETAPIKSNKDWQILCSTIIDQLSDEHQKIHLIAAHTIAKLNLTHEESRNADMILASRVEPKESTWLSRLLNRVKLGKLQGVSVSHLVFTSHKLTRKEI